uniref:hypothetical protein n=1 Tax=Hydrogenophilus thermoluteolus TaxID=297 RepID=UPI0015D02050
MTIETIESSFATIRRRSDQAKGLREPQHHAGDVVQTEDERGETLAADPGIDQAAH